MFCCVFIFWNIDNWWHRWFNLFFWFSGLRIRSVFGSIFVLEIVPERSHCAIIRTFVRWNIYFLIDWFSYFFNFGYWRPFLCPRRINWGSVWILCVIYVNVCRLHSRIVMKNIVSKNVPIRKVRKTVVCVQMTTTNDVKVRICFCIRNMTVCPHISKFVNLFHREVLIVCPAFYHSSMVAAGMNVWAILVMQKNIIVCMHPSIRGHNV